MLVPEEVGLVLGVPLGSHFRARRVSEGRPGVRPWWPRPHDHAHSLTPPLLAPPLAVTTPPSRGPRPGSCSSRPPGDAASRAVPLWRTAPPVGPVAARTHRGPEAAVAAAAMSRRGPAQVRARPDHGPRAGMRDGTRDGAARSGGGAGACGEPTGEVGLGMRGVLQGPGRGGREVAWGGPWGVAARGSPGELVRGH